LTVRTASYNPLLISERVEPNDVGQLDLCRAASFLMVWDSATNGDYTTFPNGSRWGRGKIKSTLTRMRKATGEELRGAYNTSHMDEFAKGAGIPAGAWQMQIVKFSSVVQGLKDGFAYTLSGDVARTPSKSPLRKYVNPNVGHDIALIRLSKDGKKIAFVDPMTPHGTRRYLRWAPVSDFQKFAKEFADSAGRVVAGRIKKGSYSVMSKRLRSAAALTLEAQQNSIKFQKQRDNVRDVRDELQADLLRLEGLLEQCAGDSEAELREDLADATSRLDRIAIIVSE
jgi:hypothetical protein